MWKNQTLNPSEPRFVYQNQTTNQPKNPELQTYTYELDSIQHEIQIFS